MNQNVQNPGSDLCSLEPRVTTEISPYPESYQALLKREHAAEFFAGELTYAAIDERDNKDFLGRLHSCRTNSWFIRHIDTGEVRIATNSCRLRWCPLCAAARQNFVTGQISKWFNQALSPKLLTVTLRHTSSPLKDQVDFLYKCFRKLRQRKILARRTRGGVWFFQVKRSKDGLTWHPHIHCLIDLDFIEHKQLSKTWSVITGGSTVIDIRCVRDPERTVKHHARYVATPATLVDLPMNERIEVHDTFVNRRLVGCFGTAKTISLRPSKPADSYKWINVGSWWLVINLRGMHDVADEILFAWRTGNTLAKESTLYELEHEIEDRAPPEIRPVVHQQYLLDFYTR